MTWLRRLLPSCFAGDQTVSHSSSALGCRVLGTALLWYQFDLQGPIAKPGRRLVIGEHGIFE